jgi:GNAT superfamily N-acetyltransferase
VELDGRVRSATAGDVLGLAALHRETTLHAYAGIFPPAAPKPSVADLVPVWLDRLERSAAGRETGGAELAPPPAGRELDATVDAAVFLAELLDGADGTSTMVGAIALDFPSRSHLDERTGVAHLTAFYVRPGRWRQGWGAALHRRALREALERDAVALDVWVLEGNAQGRDWYARHGYEPTGARLAAFPELGLHDEGLRLRIGARPLDGSAPRLTPGAGGVPAAGR